ncbi:YjzD family protein [uncultured Metabacillus sp.]|uniref:YjzD family protein n=1 Tax=Metabacillus sp. Hm71 TaxID=3450743 RepID=UPI00260AEE65|nr:YjzD family protein [uncultured Metabacillus sp.]
MRFFWTFFWGFLLIHMASYVVNSMTGGHYDFMTSTILSVIAIVVIFIIAEVIPNEPAANDHH